MMKAISTWIKLVLALLVVAVVALLIINFSGLSIFGTSTKTNETQTITYLEKNKEIALVTLGIADIIDETNSKTIAGKKIPGSDKHTYIKASFEAKLGIDGKDVVITEIGEKEYEISIPRFIFIGYDDPKFEHVTNDNGVLSFITEDVDQMEMLNKMLDKEHQDEYISKYTDLLRESAEEFYNNLLPGFDKDVKLTFKYEE
jgi:hypothetical protein